MKYCNNCILPDTRPNLNIDSSGKCNACKAHLTKSDIDWEKREEHFSEVVRNAKLNSSGYDCLIPVSGGKDSTWQVIKCLEYGLNPLTVTWKPPSRTNIGSKNLKNLIDLGVDHIDYQINPKTEKAFLLKALKKYGSTAIPMHMAIFNIPLKIAVKFNIPLIVWGENSAFEYGGTKEEQTGFKLDKAWYNKFGVTHGTVAQDWISDEISKKNMEPYTSPTDAELDKSGVLAVFLGYYFQWDPELSMKVASDHGFKSRDEGSKTGYYNYADIDDDFISIHHYLKWYKFGMTRLFDNLSLEIRNGRKTREEALKIIKERGDDTPYEDIEKFCNYVNITNDEFFNIIETFRNLHIWKKDNNVWQIKDFIIKDWNWN